MTSFSSLKEGEEDKFTGHSCLLITWKTNPEVENFKDLYMDKEIKTHKRRNMGVVDPGDLVSEKSLAKNYRIIGKVNIFFLTYKMTKMECRIIFFSNLGRGS